MDALRLVPQLFFDLLARVVPGVVLLVVVAALHPSKSWPELLDLAAGNKLAAENVFSFAFFVPLGLGFVLGHLIAPIGKTMGSWVRHPGFKAPWREYDWLRMHRPDAGALVAKIRAEYTMHYSLAAAFGIGLVAGIAMHALGTSGAPSIWSLAALAVLSALSLWRGRDTEKTFANSTRQFYAVAQEELPVLPPVIPGPEG
jgi:hypothetical protein